MMRRTTQTTNVVAAAALLLGAAVLLAGGARAELRTPATGTGLQAPQQIHIALRGLSGAYDMVVSWVTMNDTSTSTVRYGTSAKALTSNATGRSRTYYRSYNHDVVLAGLAADTQYYYSCGSDEGGWSQVLSFQTAPTHPTTAAEANAVGPWTAAVYGDMGVTNSENTTAQLQKHLDDIDVVIHNGDYSYADDRIETKDYESVWDSWQNEIEFLASTKAYMTCPGNHEAACHSTFDWFCPKELDNFTAYRYRFRMPSVESGAPTAENMWHSFDYANAHIIMMDTETDVTKPPEGPHTLWNGGPFGDQLTWLKNDLAKAVANRATHPWIIVLGHRPMYTTAAVGGESIVWPNVTGNLRGDIEDMLHEAKVDLYIGAHVHGYERTFPVYREQKTADNYVNPPSLTHLVVGMSGNIEGHQGHKWNNTLPDWYAARDGENYGYTMLRVLNATTLEFEFHEAVGDAVIDSFTLVRENHLV